jgi:hypothetical protein
MSTLHVCYLTTRNTMYKHRMTRKCTWHCWGVRTYLLPWRHWRNPWASRGGPASGLPVDRQAPSGYWLWWRTWKLPC